MRDLLARKPVGKLRHSYSSTNVTTGAWVEISSSVPAAATAMEIFDSSGSIMKLAFAASGQEDSNEFNYYIIPGGSSILLPAEVAKGVRLAARAVDANATSGDLVINFFG